MYIYIYIMGLYWDNGKENGNYRDYRVYVGNILGFYWEYLARAQPTDSLSERLPAALPGTALQSNNQSNCNEQGNDTVRKNSVDTLGCKRTPPTVRLGAVPVCCMQRCIMNTEHIPGMFLLPCTDAEKFASDLAHSSTDARARFPS